MLYDVSVADIVTAVASVYMPTCGVVVVNLGDGVLGVDVDVVVVVVVVVALLSFMLSLLVVVFLCLLSLSCML